MRRKAKTAFRRRLLMIVLAIILTMICIVTIPVSRFIVAAGEQGGRSLCYTTYVVQSGDTLWDIADTHRNDTFNTHKAYIREVMRANGLESSRIYDGQLLLIPCPESEASISDSGAANGLPAMR